jgi:hypothetical protein
VKRSRAVHLILLASVGALDGCNNRQCVDENGIVVDQGYCVGTLPPSGEHGYRWYSGSYFIHTPVGSSIRSTSTIRGVFGAAGENAGAHGGGGAGE